MPKMILIDIHHFLEINKSTKFSSDSFPAYTSTSSSSSNYALTELSFWHASSCPFPSHSLLNYVCMFLWLFSCHQIASRASSLMWKITYTRFNHEEKGQHLINMEINYERLALFSNISICLQSITMYNTHIEDQNITYPVGLKCF